MTRHFLRLSDLTKDELDALLKRAVHLKARQKRGIPYRPLIGKTLGLVFEKASTRTRLSFEAGMSQLGGYSIFISPKDSQMGRGEPIKDTARVMSRYLDAVVIRTFAHSIVAEFARYSDIPVINGLTDSHHPCQVLADLMTIIEKKGGYDGMSVCWIGDGNNMANSWIEAASILGFELRLACPEGYRPDEAFFKEAASRPGAKIRMCDDAVEAAKDAQALNTDVWASMGQEAESTERRKAFAGYQINEAVLKIAAKDAIVLHCLPAHRGEEITEEVMEGRQSVVWDQAENRLHAQKAVLEFLLTKGDERQ
ncbi:MAG: ornithine carbamoyltransferase [Deltaproteobacteria bacterium]|nr:ornithine carbamoyltransferase [Deltaproteobacteria bacterium]